MTTAADLFAKHQPTLARALAATRDRTYWSAYPESLKAYGQPSEDVPSNSFSAADGKAAFEGYLGKPFPLQQLTGTGDHHRRQRRH
jgi:hypothetical protein